LETKLAAVLPTAAPRAAKDFVGRKLAIIGTAESVPALAALLPDKDLSHMARYALERIPVPEAGKALRDALAKTSGTEKAGVAGSLGARRDVESIADLCALVGDSDASIALAAATALGDIGTVESAKALQEAKPAADAVKLRVADAQLTAGERLLAAGDKAGALAVYKSLVSSKAKNVRLAATRGLLLASGK
jgi:HEAT repeat protein